MTVRKEASEHSDMGELPMCLIYDATLSTITLVHSRESSTTYILEASPAPPTTTHRPHIPTADWFRPLHKRFLWPFMDMNDTAAVERALQADDLPWYFLRCLNAMASVAIFITILGLVHGLNWKESRRPCPVPDHPVTFAVDDLIRLKAMWKK